MKHQQWKSRLRFGAATVLIAGLGHMGPIAANAQDGAETMADETLEEVVVTGSRIRRAGLDTLQPATVVSGEFIDQRAFANVADAINQVPQFGIPDQSNAGGQNALNVGQNIVNLFGLGAQRTLTVINGRRTVGQNTPTIGVNDGLNNTGGPGLQVDLNIIPTAVIDRVETIETGGAPIYGSDAIAGTVNIILKDDFEGFVVDGQYGVTEEGDGQNWRTRATFGGNFAEGRGNAVVAFEFADVSQVNALDRPELVNSPSFFPNPADTGPSDGIVDNFFTPDSLNVWQVPNTGFILLSNGAPSGVPGADTFLRNFSDGSQILPVDAAGNPVMLDFNGSLITLDQANLGIPSPTAVSFFSAGADGVNNPYVTELDETNTLVSPLERYNMFSKGHYDVTDNVRVFYEGLYSRTEAVDNNNQPTWSTIFFDNADNGSLGNYRINIAENPYVTSQIRDVLQSNGAFDPTNPEDQFFWVSRSNIDLVGDSPNFRDQDVFRVVGGLEGDFELGGRTWNWDVSYNFGQTNATTEQTVIDGERLSFATDVVVNPETGLPDCRINVEGVDLPADNGGLPGNGSDSNTASCTPLNILVFGSATAEQQAFLLQRQTQSSQIQQSVFEANIAGELFDLPAGAIGFAAGLTHRRERGEFRVGQGSQRGVAPNPPQLPVDGGFNTYEAYAEMLIPIVRNGEGLGSAIGSVILDFEIEGAVRYVDNNVAGGDPTWTLGGRLTPNILGGAFTFRANYTEAIRSPSIVELFSPQQQIGTFATDPCDQRDIESGNNTRVRRANCEAQVRDLIDQGLLPSDFNLDEFRAISRNASQSALTGGNLDLLNEQSKAWSVGVIIRPEQIPGLSLTVDWTDIEISDAIVNLSATNIMAACFDDPSFPNVPACNQFEREVGTFQPQNFVTGFTNAASRNFAGMTIQGAYSFDMAAIDDALGGVMTINSNWFYVDEDTQQVGSGDLNTFNGERANQTWRVQTNVMYDIDAFSMFVQWRHESGGTFDKDDPIEQRDIQRFPSVNLFNMGFRYQMTDNFHVRLNVDNVLDNSENPLRQASVGSNDNIFDDPLGRRFIFGAGLEF